ncbi:MAG: 4-(cytidine 5'-diphospho)-2-C-methyl-D-erythritol kinase, partial [Oscillospiraceae bacterium]|nr:4-(cytidine 5'-diphospho)-2-C-methyl-D-erythritol kinase [Oscillospiraceae bacterium]
MITLIAHAKINLFLDITGKLANGYHLLETVMQSVDLSDIVSVEQSDGITVSCSDPEIPENDGNICYKAAELFFELLGHRGGADIYIDKRIPHGAGLGGGSADAAAVLRGLNKLYGKPFDDETLLALAARVGADVPFCLVGGTKLCSGIGEVMTDTEPYPQRHFLIVKPDFECDTKAAYADYDVTMVPRRERHAGEFYNVFR